MALPDRRQSLSGLLSLSILRTETNLDSGITHRVSQRELSPQVHVGILSKYVNIGKGWKPRLFVLDSGVLKYYKIYGPSAVNVGRVMSAVAKGRQLETIGAQTSLQARSSDNLDREPVAQSEIELQAARIKESHTDSKKFYIHCGSKTLCCRAETREDRAAWLQALQAAQVVRVQQEVVTADVPIDQHSESLQAALQDLLRQLDAAGVPAKLLENVEQLFSKQHMFYQGLQNYVSTLENDKRELETRIVTTSLNRGGYTNTDEADATSGDQTSDTLVDDDETLTEEFVDCMEQDFVEDDFSPKCLSRSSSSPRSPCSPWSRMALANDIASTIKANGSLNHQLSNLGPYAPSETSTKQSLAMMESLNNHALGLTVRTSSQKQSAADGGSDGPRRSLSWIRREPPITRRTHLPPPEQAEKPVGLWSLIRECVGKDLTRICLPVYFNEPLSVLQKCCEELEYSELLDTASTKPPGSVERMILVAAFAVSGYSSTLGRTAKPFNPLLGETYELVCPEKRFRFLAEKVVHHPMVVACCAEGVGWVLEADAEMKSRFWGRSIELTPLGVMRLTFKDGDVYQWNKVTSSVNNVVIGKLYVDLCGLMRVRNMQNQMVAKITFKEQSMFEKQGQQVRGHIEDANGAHLGVVLHGAWSKDLWVEDGDGRKDCLWVKSPPPANPTRYNLTQFAIQLNEMTAGLEGKLAPTDCRLRPDQRMLEIGRYDQSNKEKQRLEIKQRAARKAAEEGEPIHPRWFTPVTDAQQGKDLVFKYQGGYWESRDQGNFMGCRDIYGN